VCKSREATRAVSKHAQNRILLLDKSASKMEREVRDGSFAGEGARATQAGKSRSSPV
jgi:hypothetical protein